MSLYDLKIFPPRKWEENAAKKMSFELIAKAQTVAIILMPLGWVIYRGIKYNVWTFKRLEEGVYCSLIITPLILLSVYASYRVRRLFCFGEITKAVLKDLPKMTIRAHTEINTVTVAFRIYGSGVYLSKVYLVGRREGEKLNLGDTLTLFYTEGSRLVGLYDPPAGIWIGLMKKSKNPNEIKV